MRAWRLPVGVTRRRGDDARIGSGASRMETAGRRVGPYLHFGTQRANAAFAAPSYSKGDIRAGTSAFRVHGRLFPAGPAFRPRIYHSSENPPVFPSRGRSHRHVSSLRITAINALRLSRADALPELDPGAPDRSIQAGPSKDGSSSPSNACRTRAEAELISRSFTIIAFARDSAGAAWDISAMGDAMFPRCAIQREGRVS